ncbi:protein priA [Thelephora terrestris]|uniref:Protein priA n=1 Tax=Thelephora terrestris TaxID=56493 RepID=A0A9P6HF04_9AGAM|nr:protein priA [Thelephora terrestris]
MTLISRILLLALAVPFVLADGGNCGGGQFKWSRKDCCLPNGGPSTPPSPPSGKDCPSNWSWNHGLGCCAPHQQPPSNPPPPQCHNGWNWSDNSLCCNPPTTPSTPSKPSTPSGKPGDCDDDKNNGQNNGQKHKRLAAEKRQNRSRNVAPCPKGLSACPVSSLIGGDYECVNTLEDLDNCGGCATLGEGQNCNAIFGVWNVGCEQSACKIYTCADGYTLSQDEKSCHPL